MIYSDRVFVVAVQPPIRSLKRASAQAIFYHRSGLLNKPLSPEETAAFKSNLSRFAELQAQQARAARAEELGIPEEDLDDWDGRHHYPQRKRPKRKREHAVGDTGDSC